MTRRPEPTLILDGHMKGPISIQLDIGESVYHSVRCPDKDGPNEDGAVVAEAGNGLALLAVADGMGGGPVGHEAARIVLTELIAAAGNPNTVLREAVLSAVESANERVLDLGVGAGTTLAVAELDGNRLRTYHVGDAHVLLVGQRGKIRRLTVAHAPVSYAVEAGLLEEADALVHEDRHLVSNVVGQSDMRVEIGAPIAMRPLDTLLLASDGVFDNLSIQEIVERVCTGPLLGAVDALVAQCRGRMASSGDGPSKPDDITVVAFRLRRRETGR